MGDENPIRILGGYSKPSHEGYRNTIELPVGNNVVPLRSDTIRLVQNGCSFHELWTANLRNDILIFQQNHGESLSEAWTLFKDLIHKVPHHGIDLWLQVQKFYDHVNPVTRQTIDQSAGGKLRDRNAEESWELLEDLALYDNENAKLSKFEADFKQQQSEMTNKIDTLLKAITDRIAGALPSDTVKNPKLSTSLVLSAHSYPIIDPQCSSHPSTSINAIKAHSKEAYISQTRRGFLATANAVIDCRMAKIVVVEGITRSVFGVKGVDLDEDEAPY
ncbi:hypothetical protein Tco_0939808 [Tanacetum coccineum]|uniref:Zinc finger, CCHC-type n=1 Tax=Tanacetum coccineum TaxID=301880 RepID=A0ABQ5DNP8_9ASTR